VLCVAGWLSWLRYLARASRSQEAEADLAAAAEAFHLIYLVAPPAVPVPLAVHFESEEFGESDVTGGPM
jgi:hypothetical protein